MNVWKLLKRLGISAICLIAALAALPASANTTPPTFAFHYYGDCNGDMIIDSSDISQMKLFTLALPYTYDTLQPQNGAQDWNTSDLTSDRILDAEDISLAKMWMLGFQLSIPDKPWTLSNFNLPLAGNTAGVFVPFQANLTSTSDSLPSGRPCITVKAEIDVAHSTVTGSLSGRTCTPVEGSRDQAALAGAQCALSVTQTDWGAHTDQGLTETGTYGFALKADGFGTVRVVLSIAENTALNIPPVSISVQVGFGTIWHVKSDATGANNGTSWADAFTVVQNGMNAASSGDMVWVAQGTYYRPGSGTIPVLIMKDGVKIYGGFVGTETSLAERGNPSSHVTTLDGQLTSLHGVEGASNAVFDGFTVTRASDAPYYYNAVGMLNSTKSNLVVSNSVFKGNVGAAMANQSSSITITNCVFDSNYLGIFNNSCGNTSIVNCSFTNNAGSGVSFFSQGAGIGNLGCSPRIENCLFVGNRAKGDGGAIFNGASSSPTIINCTIRGNLAMALGSGIANENNSHPIIINTILWQNTDTMGQDFEIYVDGTSSIVASYSNCSFSRFPPFMPSYCTGIGNIFTNPLFAGASDPHLTSGSPCKDTGTSSGAPTIDLEGNPRPSCSGYDMGAYEYQCP